MKAYLGFEGGEILRLGALFWNPPWRGGTDGGRRGCFQAGFWRRLMGWGMGDLRSREMDSREREMGIIIGERASCGKC